MTQKEALERLAKWGMGATWAYEWYLDLLARNVAACVPDFMEAGVNRVEHTVDHAINLTHATIQSLEVDDDTASTN